MPTETPFPSDGGVVVVGTGPAGAAAALQLIRAGVQVTLVDAGLEEAGRGLTARIGGLTIARVHRPLEPRTRSLRVTGDPATVLFEDIAPGGLTNHWSCAVPRFSPDDFLDGRRAGEAFTWPLEYDELAPWYSWVEPLLRIAGSSTGAPQLPAGEVAIARSLEQTAWAPIAEAAKRVGQAIVPIPYVYGGRSTVTLSGNVFNSFVRLIKPKQRSSNLRIKWGAQVTQLEWSGATKRVEAVLVRDVRTGAMHRMTCRAVVLAAGAVNTTKILLQSISPDFPEGLGNAEGVLGRYLHDHPLAKLELELASPLSFQPPAYVTRLPLEGSAPLYAAACLQWSGAQRVLRSILAGHPGRETTVGFSVFGTMAPAEHNRVFLDREHPSTDGTPGLGLDIRHPPESAQALAASRDQLIALLDAAGLRPKTRLWLIDPVGTSIHYAGSCRMHAVRRFGMLDRWSRMHAVRNVAVADSAAFTTGAEKNPVLTAMALAARAANRLVDELRTGVL